MDSISIVDLELEARVGVTEAERARPQRLVVSVELECDLAAAGRTDAESDTTRYDVVADQIRRVVSERPRKLVEAIAEAIAREILSQPLVHAVTVEVRKFSVPGTRFVAVKIRRERPRKSS